MSKGMYLKKLTSREAIIVIPGVYDSLSGFLAENAGFKAVFLSGSAVSYSQLGKPDIGLITMNEMLDICMRLNDRVNIPILVDIDRGFGNTVNAARSIRSFEAAGASAVQVEDQIPINHINDLKGRPLVSAQVMVDKIKSMVDERRNENTLISVRTDSPFTESFEKVLDRISLYKDAGADILFAEGLKSSSEIKEIVQRAENIPVLYNLLRMDTDISSADQLEKLGVSIVLFPGNAISNVFDSLTHTFNALKENPDLEVLSFKTPISHINSTLGMNDILNKYKNYSS